MNALSPLRLRLRLRLGLGLWAIFGLAASSWPPPLVADQAPLAVYGQLPFMDHVALSPDGTRFAFSTGIAKDEEAVIVSAVADLHQVAAVRSGEQKLRRISWADDEQLLIEASATKLVPGWAIEPEELTQLYSCEVATGKILDLMDRNFGMSQSAHVFGYITGEPRARRIGGETTVYVRGDSLTALPSERRTWYLPTLFRINLGSSHAGVVDTGDVGPSIWLLDEAARVVATETHSELSQRWSIKLRTATGTREVLKGESALDYPLLEGVGPDGSSVWVYSEQDEPQHWRRLSLEDGSASGLEPDAEQYREVLLDRRSDRIIGAVSGDDHPQYRFFNPQTEQGWATAYKALAAMNPHLISWSDDQRKMIVLLQTPTAGLLYVLVNLDTGKVSGLGPAYKGLTSIAEVRPISYAAGDGLNIPGYLTLPHGREARNLPLVVLPHGGPEARDTGDFDWLSQALAAQGYAVLRPNFRGSTVTRAHVAAGYGQWGRKMQTDVSDGVRYLAGQGLIDLKRVCIVGASYGGYAALAGAAFQPDLYRCAVSIAGIADLRRLMQEIKGTVIRNNSGEQYFQRWFGVTSPADAGLLEVSPIEHVEAITAPVLLIHGRDDTVVKYEQSRLMADALRRAHKNVTTVDLKQEDHWLSHSATRLQALDAVVAFLQANNPP